MSKQNSPNYIGRFAPSPTGPLHLGSLVAALASYLDARANGGKWLVRMEDLDPPREEAGAADRILQALEAHQLHWDETVLYQSQRLDHYQQLFESLSPYCYRCGCTRDRIRSLDGRYDRHCLQTPPRESSVSATRLRIDQLSDQQQQQAEHFDDLFLGEQITPLDAHGDIIIRRKDTLFAYQLAVVIDDLDQGINHVIRGRDLLDSTGRQRYIWLLLNTINKQAKALPLYGHTPLVMGEDGDKLSKQTHAPALDNHLASDNLITALGLLNHPPPIAELPSLSCESILEWAISAWQRQRVPFSTQGQFNVNFHKP